MPFIELPTIHLGPVPIQFFGILFAIGVLVGTSVTVRYATHYKLNEDNMRYVGMRVIIFGFIMCHLLDVFFYTPGKVLEEPLIIFKLIEGIASYGGILGATLAFTYYAKKLDLHYLRYGDAIVYGFSFGLFFGRIGCATAHDHLGVQTDFPLAVHVPKLMRCPELTLPSGLPDVKAMADKVGCQNWSLPDGSADVLAHDLGLYEVFVLGFLIIVLSLVAKFWKTRRPGTLVVICALYYAPIRFFFDFLRFPDSDPRYLGLTPAQHLCIWTVIGGIVTLNAMRKPHNQSLFEPEDEPCKIPNFKPAKSSAEETKPKAKPKAKVVRKKKKK
jgi:phosphatidylglycerol:prolipoprotein diacylglycerol transferase